MAEFDMFCERLPRQSRNKMVDAIEAEIKSLRGRSMVKKKAPRFSPERDFASQYDSDIKKLDKLAEFISGDRDVLKNLSESDVQLFEDVLKRII